MARKRKKTTRRRTIRASPRRSYKRSRSSGMGKLGKWFPLSTQEHMEDLAAGATSGLISDWTRPLQDKYLGGIFGEYSDEAALGIVGALVHKMTPSGFVKNYGKELYRIAVISAGQGLGRSAFAGMGGSGNDTSGNTLIIG